MAERLFGLETEYAFTALDSQGARLNREEALSRFIQLAKNELPHLPDAQSSNGFFLPNGSRFYIDQGSHPELSTPECANPWDLVRYTLAGERMLADLAADLENKESTVSQALFFKCNVDYSGTQSTWGCHESYLHRADPSLLSKQIIPHLVSRLIYTGAGGFNSLSPGVEFMLSPRVPHLVVEVSNNSTAGRGIFHTKDEPLCGKGYHRLHIICGESLSSEAATWLKVGTTALVVAMIEAGLHPADAVEPRSSLYAMHCFARDTEHKAVVKGTTGKDLSAIVIQRHYLTQAEAHLPEVFMPPWAEEVCRQWRAMLDRLESSPASLVLVLDWQMKLALYKDRVRQRGLTWESLSYWTHLLLQLYSGLQGTEYEGTPVSLEFILGRRSPIANEVKQLTPAIRREGLTWDDLGSFLALRQELFEIDTRFGQLGNKGIFAAMNRAGVLNHHVPGVDTIEQAMVSPPSMGRARLRGEHIRRLAAHNNGYVCDWAGISDQQGNCVLDLSDPFASKGYWQDRSKEENTAKPGLRAQPSQRPAAAWRRMVQGMRALRLRS